MKSSLRKLVRFATLPSALAGAMLGATLAGVVPEGVGLVGVVPGWLYGVVVGSLVRAFRVPPGAYPLAGLLSGPVPFALLLGKSASEGDRAVIWIGLVAGLVVGFVEWGHARHRAARAALDVGARDSMAG